MGILTRLFGSTEGIAKQIESDDAKILKIWHDYLSSLEKKESLLNSLIKNLNLYELHSLKHLVRAELVEVKAEEKSEEELIEDLEYLSHDTKIQRIHRLDACLNYTKTKDEYAVKLLDYLHDILSNEYHLVAKLAEGAKNKDKLITLLSEQLKFEKEIITKINEFEKRYEENFHDFFLKLAKGEHIIKKLDKMENRFIDKMLSQKARDQYQQNIIYEWDEAVINAIENKYHKIAAMPNQENARFEVVNRPDFIDLATEAITSIRKKNGKIAPSKEAIQAFVHLFREAFNEQGILRD